MPEPVSRPNESVPPHAIVMQLLLGGFITKLMSETTRLGVPDMLHQEGPLTAQELIRRGSIRAAPAALHRALRACAAVGLVTEDGAGRFHLTPLTDVLRRDAPGSLKPLVEFTGDVLWRVWSGLREGLRTGHNQATPQLGMDFFAYLGAHPVVMEQFAEAMKANSFTATQGVLAHYDFHGIRKIVDVGGGLGHLVSALLARYPLLHGVVFDLPDVIVAARQQARVDEQASARLEFVAGDMFQALPAADAYLLKLIMHDWDDAQCVTILRNCRAHLDADGRVLCVDAVLPALGDVSNAPAKILDVNMMLVLPGRERTRVEWEMLFREAGLGIHAVVPIPEDTFGACIVEGRKL